MNSSPDSPPLKLSNPSDLPDGWKFDGYTMVSVPEKGTCQMAHASKMFEIDVGVISRVSVFAESIDTLSRAAIRMERTLLRPPPEAIMMNRQEIGLILMENEHLSKQIGQMQQSCTLKEMQLRAHRRVTLTDEQTILLKKDLEATTNEVLRRYAKSDQST